jgi:hypothetical protein
MDILMTQEEMDNLIIQHRQLIYDYQHCHAINTVKGMFGWTEDPTTPYFWPSKELVK